jgi:NinB protein
MKFILAHQLARTRALDAVRTAPDGWHVSVTEPRRNLEQNAALHARLTEIAQSREWAGRRWDVEVWKRLLTAAWCRATGQQVLMLPALDGHGVDVVFRRTSELTRSECGELLEFINAWDAQECEA